MKNNISYESIADRKLASALTDLFARIYEEEVHSAKIHRLHVNYECGKEVRHLQD